MPEPTLHKSDSLEQRRAEPDALAKLNSDLDLNLRPASVSLPNGTRVQLDGFDGESKVACEIYCRVGRLKGSQPDKLASDILKLILVEHHLGGTWQKIICLVDAEAARSLTNQSWLASACKAFGVEVVTVNISDAARQSLLTAQARQQMINIG